MKKIILGLFLTTGISGIALANGISSDFDFEKMGNENFLNIEEDLLSCTTTHVMRWYDCDGSFSDTKVATTEGACGNREEESLNFEIFRVDGCPTG